MAVTCPGCGRGYDVTLFQFGRTIDCACGSRVGRRAPDRHVNRGPETRFFCDAMLGRLARWLRALGYDACHDPHVDDGVLARTAVREERLILTRDRSLPDEWRVGGCLVLRDGDPLELLRRVRQRLGLEDPPAPFSRCLECNTMLRRVEPETVAESVPPRIRREQDQFRRCNDCGRVYWEGSHVRRMRRKLRAALDLELGDGGGKGT